MSFAASVFWILAACNFFSNRYIRGCRMKLQEQLVVTCRAQKEIVTRSSCGRILYYTRDMELATTE
jgi:hypothetical protein